MVIADECHHLSDQQNWGESFQNAFSSTVARLMTTGTAFRSDGAGFHGYNIEIGF